MESTTVLVRAALWILRLEESSKGDPQGIVGFRIRIDSDGGGGRNKLEFVSDGEISQLFAGLRIPAMSCLIGSYIEAAERASQASAVVIHTFNTLERHIWDVLAATLPNLCPLSLSNFY
ncbi:hypothetical protein TorRG33x02_162420 [Trema orientale]|uniref:Uncharacterized protein n=1 Tax=Trema orientale TaxID=63057 RepID=A0A2P5ER57_TREOI|nr:hypothetical protein TorRG33x02_162420 [Trema orientale]